MLRRIDLFSTGPVGGDRWTVAELLALSAELRAGYFGPLRTVALARCDELIDLVVAEQDRASGRSLGVVRGS